MGFTDILGDTDITVESILELTEVIEEYLIAS